MKKVYIAGNWKMNKSLNETISFLEILKDNQSVVKDNVVQIICPPNLFLVAAKEIAQATKIMIGAQNVSEKDNGAFTGEISTQMLQECRIDYCIIGHSERRQFYHENDALIGDKYLALKQKGIIPIICVGETLEQRESNQTEEVIRHQLQGIFKDKSLTENDFLLIAYEPVWAIGTGRTATPEIAQEVHHFIRNWLSVNFNHIVANNIPLLYGGSVKPDNIKELLMQDDIEGALIGGASLDISSYIKMIELAGEIE